MKKLALLAIAAILTGIGASAQMGGFGKKIFDKAASSVSVSANSILKAPDPITTSFKDVDHTKELGPDDIKTNFPSQPNIAQLQRTPNGGFILKEGSWFYIAQSYCLKAGTQGPSKGFGYMYAQTKGLCEDQVMTIVRKSVNHPNVAQKEIQLLLWAIIAHAKFEDLQPRVKATAVKFLSPAQLAQLNRSAIDLIPEGAMAKARASVPKEVQMILDAENQLRGMLTNPAASFEDMERVAVLAAGNIMGNEETKPGMWTWHPAGYYIRFFPVAYYQTRVEIYVPAGSAAVGKEYDPAMHIAAPALTGRQRLLMSARYYEEETNTPPRFPDPVIFELIPDRGQAGDMIKIQGDNFRSESRIFFGNIETDYIRSMNKTEIYVRVPPNAVTAPVKVVSPTSQTESATNFTVPPVVLTMGITTSLPDGKWTTIYGIPENFEPREKKRSMFEMQRTPNGGFVMTPGYYEFIAYAFNIKAGKQVATPGGTGYLFAPPKGPREDAVMTVLRNSVHQPQIPIEKIRELMDFLVKGTPPTEFTASARATASQLMTPRQMDALNRSPAPIANTDTARITQPYMENSWNVHPDGYYVRYIPRDAYTFVVQIWVPQGCPGVGKEFDPATHVAVPADVTKDRFMFCARMRETR